MKNGLENFPGALYKPEEKKNEFLDDETLKKWKILGDNENLEDGFRRVSDSVAIYDENYGGDKGEFIEELAKQFDAKKIIPSTSIMMNAGRIADVPLSACAVPPVELRDEWNNIKAKVDELHFQGMGTGFNLDETDRPIELLKFLNKVGVDGQKSEEQLRPVGNMATMSLDNPNVLEFINLKDDADITKEDWVFNLSVNVENAQIEKILDGKEILLSNGEKVDSDKLLTEIAEGIWASGDPGLIFMDRVRSDNAVPSAGESVSVAPCGEIGLARGESCQFTYVNLGEFVKNGEVDYEGLKETIGATIHFLDNVVDYNIDNGSNEDVIKMLKNKRKIGLGVCGFADLLDKLSIQYGSDESVELASDLFSFINYQSKLASVALAEERGSFELFRESQYSDGNSHLMNRLKKNGTKTVSQEDWSNLNNTITEKGIRNCSTIALPPTGRSSRIINASQSIEPHIKEFLQIPNKKQIELIGAMQRFVDESISKTINVNHDTSVEEIKELLINSMKSNLKGITIYRDGSRSNQPSKI